MDPTSTLIERLRAHWGGATNYGLAKRLGITKSAVTRYARHGGSMSNEIGVRVADELGLPHAYVVACLALEREHSEQIKPVWKAIVATLQRGGKTAPAPARARRTSKVAAVLLAAGIAGFSATTPPQAQAGQDAASVYYG